jgi:beta-ureidopropionase / N-carbamoyl-L-amino-acid hydrolase
MSMNRRRFLHQTGTTTALAMVTAGLRPLAWSDLESARANAKRLQASLEKLSEFGRPSGGTFADGVSRVAYSDADLAGRQYLMGLMKVAGLAPRIDAAGNILGRREGSDASLPPIVFGSHIDSVPNGGNFDGDLGSLAAIEAIHVLQEQGLRTRHALELVVWANEEGVAYGRLLCGSRAAAGRLVEGELDESWEGVTKRDAIRKIGGAPERIEGARRGPFHGYLELHIEQGGTLAKDAVPIGIVEGIVATDRYEVVIRGVANHAGTTTMADRQDAFLAASHLAIAVNQLVRAEAGRQVGTIGRLNVTPNVPNVIPGLVRHSLELRDLSSAKIARLGEAIKTKARAIAESTRTEIEITQTSHDDSALATEAVQTAIEGATRRLQLASRRMPSAAVHDAQIMSRLGPMGMIFVPSVGGISHSPKELTSWEDCANGANVLLQSIVALDSADLG